MQTVADLAAVALDNARSLEREQQRRRQIEAVRSVTAELTRELDLPSLLDLILMRAGQFVPLRGDGGAAVGRGEPRRWSRRPGAAWATGSATTRLGLGDGAAGAAARHPRGHRRRGLSQLAVQDRPVPDEAGPTSVMAVPLIYQDRLIGVLTANRFGVVESFNRHDLELLEVFGAQAAVAIENARLFEQATTAEALRELAQLKAELLNTVSHELRTPLSLIHGYAELLVHRAEHLDPAEVAQMSGEIYASSRTLARLVDDLLDFSHLDHGRLQLRRKRIALGELLESLARTFGTQPGGERIATELEAGLEVDADPERLHQVVGNLLSNALAYTSRGPIMVRAASRDGTRAGGGRGSRPGPGARGGRPGLGELLPGTESAQLPNRGQRPGPDRGQADRGAARRHGRGAGHARRRRDVLVHAARRPDCTLTPIPSFTHRSGWLGRSPSPAPPLRGANIGSADPLRGAKSAPPTRCAARTSAPPTSLARERGVRAASDVRRAWRRAGHDAVKASSEPLRCAEAPCRDGAAEPSHSLSLASQAKGRG